MQCLIRFIRVEAKWKKKTGNGARVHYQRLFSPHCSRQLAHPVFDAVSRKNSTKRVQPLTSHRLCNSIQGLTGRPFVLPRLHDTVKRRDFVPSNGVFEEAAFHHICSGSDATSDFSPASHAATVREYSRGRDPLRMVDIFFSISGTA